jgi:mannose-6-phosphate isomerase
MDQFGNLPYLLKILDVKDMLSIQVHPNKQAAEEGFRKENELTIPLTAPNRNYKDDNHKPEMMVALSDFWLLHGFSPAIDQHLDAYGFLHGFNAIFQAEGIKGLYQQVMELPQEDVDRLIAPHIEAIMPMYEAHQLPKSSPDFWAARAVHNFCGDGHFDRGIFSIYLFNILNLKPGEGIFQGAGMPHAYLEGQNIELMSNSDNVLRGGLTNKHIDVKELMNNTLFVETVPHILEGDLELSSASYKAPVDDFQLTYYLMESGQQLEIQVDKPSVILMTEGQVKWISESKEIDSFGVDAVYVHPGESIRIESCSTSRLFVASTG